MLYTTTTIVEADDLSAADDMACDISERCHGAVEVHETTDEELAGFNPVYLQAIGIAR